MRYNEYRQDIPPHRTEVVKISLVILLGIATIVTGVSLFEGRSAKAAIESYGSKLLGVPVTVKAVALLPWIGRGAVLGLRVGNPPGYKGEYLFQADATFFWLDPSSLDGNPFRFFEITVYKPDVNWEDGSTGSNFARLQTSLTREPASEESGEKRWFVGDLHIEGPLAAARIKGLGPEAAQLRLPDIELTDVGRGGVGISAKEIVSELFNRMSTAVIHEATSIPKAKAGLAK